MLSRQFAFLGLTLSVASVAHAEAWSTAEWDYITTTSSKSAIFARKISLRTLPPVTGRDFPVRQLWIAFDYTAVKSEKNRKSLQLIRLDCSNEKYAIASITDYLPNGKVSFKSDDTDDYYFKYKPVVPDSISAMVMNYACKREPASDTRPPLDTFWQR